MAESILDLCRTNPAITIPEMAVKLELTEDGINYHLGKLRAQNRLARVGGGYASYNASNGDHFVNPELRYSLTDKVRGAVGANLFGGKPWGQFVQLARDDNVHLQARYEF